MDAVQFNHVGLGTVFFGRDLPAAWPGREIIFRADQDGSGEIEGFERGLVNWREFTEAVREFQTLAMLKPDGKLGPLTLKALTEEYSDGVGPEERSVLARVGDLEFRRPRETTAPPAELIEMGPTKSRAMAECFNAYGGALIEEAGRLDIPVPAILAVFATEAAGRGYDPLTGLCIIRVERTRINGAWVTRWKKNDRSGETAFRREFGAGQKGEWAGLTALGADRGAEFACQKTSFGLGQVMGFNCRTVGFATAAEMALAFQDSCRAQVRGFGEIIRANHLEDEIRDGKFRAVALAYNGPGQVDYYAGVIRSNLELAKTLGV